MLPSKPPLEQPVLSLVSTEAGHELSWSAHAGFFNLYSTTNLTPPIGWQWASEVPWLTNGTWNVRLPVRTQRTMFYRLQTK